MILLLPYYVYYPGGGTADKTKPNVMMHHGKGETRNNSFIALSPIGSVETPSQKNIGKVELTTMS